MGNFPAKPWPTKQYKPLSASCNTAAIKAGRVTRGRVCFCVLASESTSVLIYILNTVNCCFCITFINQRAVHFQVIRRAVQKAYYHYSRTTADYSL